MRKYNVAKTMMYVNLSARESTDHALKGQIASCLKSKTGPKGAFVNHPDYK